ncbi:redox-regulated ATPase YchF [Candidatus Woesearchaeota archaeon]|nr:redox-regulated ATPase YchF [Candidatus Woesearchaeota archaeon]
MIIGVVGKANVGKSTFFKASTLMDVEIANYPFATIKPNSGVGFVRIDCVDKFFGKQCNPRVGYCVDGQRFVAIDMIDVAGLVPGAHEGKGMGLEFLNDLNQADALIHVIDVSGSTNEKGEPAQPNTRDPALDIKFMEDELDFWYLSILKKTWEKFSRQVQQTNSDVDKALHKQFSGLGSSEDMIRGILSYLDLDAKILVDWSEDELFKFARALRIKTKPMLIVANKIDVPGAMDNYLRLKNEFPSQIIVPCSAESELALKEAHKHKLINYVPGNAHFEVIGALSDKQKVGLDFIKNDVLDKNTEGTGVQASLNATVFSLLKYIPVFPGGVNKLEDQHGNVLPDCFLLPEKSTALDFAFKIHTDLGKGFIRAIDVKTKRTVGKDHVLNFGDVVEIISDK